MALHVKLYADGSVLDTVRDLALQPHIAGFTTNPTLARRAGVTDYAAGMRALVEAVGAKPISIEVLGETYEAILSEARHIAAWGEHVYVKVPVTDPDGRSLLPLMQRLGLEGVKVNCTAVTTERQICDAVEALFEGAPSVLSVFAGRIADAGVNPCPIMRYARSLLYNQSNIQLLWASTREVYNIVQANDTGCDIVTVTPEILAKLAGFHRTLADVSLDTVRMFAADVQTAGYTLDTLATVR